MVLLPQVNHKGLNRFTSTAPLKNLQNSSQNYIETKILAQHSQRVIPPT